MSRNKKTAAILLTIGVLIGAMPRAHAAEPYDICNGTLMLVKQRLGIVGKLEGFCLLPTAERGRILRACKLNKPCTAIGVSQLLTCGADCFRLVKVVAVFAGNVAELPTEEDR